VTTEAADGESTRSDVFTDLGLTLPIFVLYHLGVAFLPMRNAADMVTTKLTALANHSLPLYASLTVGIGGSYVLLLSAIGQRQILSSKRFVFLAIEGVAYAFLMRMIGGWALEALPLGILGDLEDTWGSVVMSLGAGFYEELVFRVLLFGGGAWLVRTVEGISVSGVSYLAGWAVLCAVAFSGWHHLGPSGEAFDVPVFVYRTVCGLVLTTIFYFRGFAPAVWTHVIYDLWAMGVLGGAE
jgi:hypothetical protein